MKLTAVLVVFIVLKAITTSTDIPTSRKRGESKRHNNYHKFHSFKRCDKESGTESINATFYRGLDKIEYMDADVIYNRGAKTLSKFKFLITKCVDAVSSNTCEYFHTWSWTLAICQLFIAKNMPWSAIIEAVHPSTQCPIKPITYRLRNATLDTNLISNMGVPLEGNTFVVEGQTYDQNNDLLLCFVLEFEVQRRTG